MRPRTAQSQLRTLEQLLLWCSEDAAQLPHADHRQRIGGIHVDRQRRRACARIERSVRNAELERTSADTLLILAERPIRGLGTHRREKAAAFGQRSRRRAGSLEHKIEANAGMRRLELTIQGFEHPAHVVLATIRTAPLLSM